MKSLNRFLKNADTRRQEFAQAALEFSEAHRGAFVFLADPDTDVMMFAYRGIHIPVRMLKPDGSRMHVVGEALKYEKGKDGTRSVDQFLLVVDSALVNIAEALYNRRRKATGKVRAALEYVGLQDLVKDRVETHEGIMSPIQVERGPERSQD